MKRSYGVIAGILVIAFAVFGCATQRAPSGEGWVTLIDGSSGLENWIGLGDANWRQEGGAIVADKGKGGFLVSKKTYTDFEIYAEFWAETDTNSGIFIRGVDPTKVGSDTSYEVNIWDIRPDPKYGTGAIVDVAAVPVPITNTAGGHWNTYEIQAKGPQMTVKLNGITTASAPHDKFKSGIFALQYGAGVNGAQSGPIKWRKVMIRPL